MENCDRYPLRKYMLFRYIREQNFISRVHRLVRDYSNIVSSKSGHEKRKEITCYIDT